jgi:carboxyl-terminal processing protease
MRFIMKYRGPLFFSFLVIAFLIAAFYPPKTENSEKEAVLMRTILTFMDKLHFDPKPVDDNFSEELYDLYLDRLDGHRRFLTKEDITRLEPYRRLLDDEAREGVYAFFDLSMELLVNGISKARKYYQEIMAHPLSFDSEEFVELDGDKREFAEDNEELKDYWRRYVKYEVISRLARKLEQQKDIGEEGERKSMDELEQEVRRDVLKMFDDWFDRMEKIRRSDRLSHYLNAITNIFDPHSVYFEPVEKQNFDIRFSGKLEGIGARLQAEGDFTKVVEVVVGGPAWKGRELQENDVILKVGQGNEPPVDIAGMNINEVVALIRGKKGTEVRLTVKKVDGTLRTIPIVRDVVVFEERYARSLILDGVAPGERFGYIYLPGFYADFDDPNGRFSADDVAAELEKLKAEKVQGIILDLRNNGGGSLRDVVRMSGFFIEDGPIVQVKSREGKPDVLTDTDPRVQYNGPLLVLVNHFSASASEILAAALQDYGRAVIVGSNSTFGKGTVQRFFDLDQALRSHSSIKPLGEIKLTTQKFYRINGGSTQLRGVTPDIVLPDNYHFISIGEREESYAMQWTKIDPVKYRQNVYRAPSIDRLSAKSEERVKNNPTFQNILENARRLEEQRDMSRYPLGLSAYLELSRRQEQEAKQFDNLFGKVVNEGVINLEVDLPSIHADESKQARNEDFIQTVAKDIYIRESVNILHDMVRVK